jgi:hypothetical protein
MTFTTRQPVFTIMPEMSADIYVHNPYFILLDIFVSLIKQVNLKIRYSRGETKKKKKKNTTIMMY